MRLFHRTREASSRAFEERIRAERDLAVTRSQTQGVYQLAVALREIRQRNHVAEAFESAFQRGRR